MHPVNLNEGWYGLRRIWGLQVYGTVEKEVADALADVGRAVRLSPVIEHRARDIQ